MGGGVWARVWSAAAAGAAAAASSNSAMGGRVRARRRRGLAPPKLWAATDPQRYLPSVMANDGAAYAQRRLPAG